MEFVRGTIRSALAAIVLVVTMPSVAIGQTRTNDQTPGYGSSGRDPERGNGGGGGGSNTGTTIAVTAGVVALGCLIFCPRHPAHHDEGIDEAKLATDGPQFDLYQEEGSLAVHGFVQSGWPLVIDFQPRPGSVTVASISIKGRKPVLMTLDQESDGRRRVLNAYLPASSDRAVIWFRALYSM